MNERIDIAPILQGRINKTDLIGPEAHIFQVIYYENLGSGVMFSVSTHNYLLQLGMNDDAVFLIRNNVKVAAALAPPDNRTGPFLVEVVWSPTELTIMVGDRSGPSRRNSVQTPPTFPPHSLHEWARRQSLIPTVTYESPVKVYEAVIDQLQQLKKRLLTLMQSMDSGTFNITATRSYYENQRKRQTFTRKSGCYFTILNCSKTCKWSQSTRLEAAD